MTGCRSRTCKPGNMVNIEKLGCVKWQSWKAPISVASLVTWLRFVQSLQSKRAQQKAYLISGIQKREPGAGKSVDYFFYIFVATPHIFVSFWCRRKMSQQPRKTVSKMVTLNSGNRQLLLGNLSSVSRVLSAVNHYLCLTSVFY